MNNKEKITFVSPPHERPKKEIINEIPKTPTEFYEIVNNAPWPELKNYGFRKWETMRNVVRENIEMSDKPKIISIPTYTMDQAVDAIIGNDLNPSGNMLIDLSSKEEIPMEMPTEDIDIILFPGEWYNIIPDGFIVVGLSGEKYQFKNGKCDDDIRFGCLPYGITRKSTPQ